MSWRAVRFKYCRPAGKVIRETESTHHRKPRSIGGTNEERNLIELPISKHRSWHNLFRNFDAHRIAREINERYLDPDYEFIVRRKVIEIRPPA